MSNDVEATAEAGGEALKITIDEFRRELRSKGLTDKLLVRKLKQGLNAKVTKVFNDKDDGIVYSDPLIDFETRRKYLDMLLKLENLYPAQKTELEGKDGGPIKIEVIDRYQMEKKK